MEIPDVGWTELKNRTGNKGVGSLDIKEESKYTLQGELVEIKESQLPTLSSPRLCDNSSRVCTWTPLG